MYGTRKFSLFTTIILFTLIILSFTCLASAGSTIGFSPAQLSVGENEEFTLDIVITADVNVSGAELELSYDPELVSITSINEGDFFKQSGKSTIFSKGNIDNDAGTATGIYCAIIGEDMPLEAGTFATVTLSSKENSGVADIEMSNVIITNSAGEELPVSVSNVKLVIGDAEIVAEGQEDMQTGSESQQTGQNTLVPLVFALMCLYITKRK